MRWQGVRRCVRHRVADPGRNNRLLLAADAAHVGSPAGDQGMNTGTQDGYALGQAFRRRAVGRLRSGAASGRPESGRLHRPDDTGRATRNRAGRHVRNIALRLLGRLPAVRTELAELNYR